MNYIFSHLTDLLKNITRADAFFLVLLFIVDTNIMEIEEFHVEMCT